MCVAAYRGFASRVVLVAPRQALFVYTPQQPADQNFFHNRHDLTYNSPFDDSDQYD
jgi:hypothetical protein